MSDIWDKYRYSSEQSGYNQRKRQIQAMKDKVLRDISNNPSYKSITINGIQHGAVVTSTKTFAKKNIIMQPEDDFEVGDVIIFNDSHWLIVDRDSDDDVYAKGVIQLCNRILSWQNNNGEIISRWITATDTYSETIKDGVIIPYSKRQFKIQISYDGETSRIGIDKRFMIGITDNKPQVVRVTRVDDVTNRYDSRNGVFGFIVLTVEADVYNPQTDNSELMIADYKKALTDIVSNTESNLEIRCLSKDNSVKIGGASKRFALINTITNDTTNSVQWNLSVDDTVRHLIHSSTDNGILILNADDNPMLDGITVLITGVDVNSNKTQSLQVKVVSSI